MEVLTKSTNSVSEQIILDAGCGTGNYLLTLANRVGTLHGLDLNSGMLEQAEKKTKRCANVFLKEGSITELPYNTDTFDGIICNQVIHHVTDGDAEQDDFAAVRQVVKSAHGTLKEGGR
jgi:ubiquinone/menaquinone biosynthesis C-methylase UbiE